MTSILAKKCVVDFENAFKENIRNLKDCHTVLSEYAGDDDEIADLLLDLKSIGNSYKEELTDYYKYQSAINAVEVHFKQDENFDDSFEMVFKDILKKTKGVESAADSIVDGILGFTKTSPDPDENGNNESIICTQSSVNPIDPITKKPIHTPFKNKVCTHVYEKNSILAYIKKRKKMVKCPYVGCTNSDMRIESLELDFSLSQRLNQGVFTSTQVNLSVTSIPESTDDERNDGTDDINHEDMDIDHC